MRRKMIVLFGLDGSGKSTQAELVRDWLTERGIPSQIVWMRGESYLTRPVLMIGKALLRAPEAAKRGQGKDRGDRYQRYVTSKHSMFRNRLLRTAWRTLTMLDLLISVRVAFGRLDKTTRIVILDRYIYDTLVDIDSAFGSGGREVKRLLASWYMKIFPKPDVVIFLDLPPTEAMKRKGDIPSIQYLEERHAVYLGLADHLAAVTIDATKGIQEIASAVVNEIEGVVA